MVTDEKIFSAASTRYRLGNVLIWLGVLTWLPFIVLRVAGEKPSLFWYLPIHLAGVIGGAHLRARARKEMGMPPPQKTRLRMVGHGMMFSGILVWVPYFYLKATQQPVDVMDYLLLHLVGVLGGTVILVVNYLGQRSALSEGDVSD